MIPASPMNNSTKTGIVAMRKWYASGVSRFIFLPFPVSIFLPLPTASLINMLEPIFGDRDNKVAEAPRRWLF